MQRNRLFQNAIVQATKQQVKEIKLEEVEQINISTYKLDYKIDPNGNIYDRNMNSVPRTYENRYGRAQVVLYDSNQKPIRFAVLVLILMHYQLHKRNNIPTDELFPIDGDETNCCVENVGWRKHQNI